MTKSKLKTGGPFPSRKAAIHAAKKAIGRIVVSGVDFTTYEDNDGWYWRELV